MKLEDIMYKINEIKECKLKNETSYTMETIWVSKIKNGGVYKAYIIYQSFNNELNIKKKLDI